MSRRRTVGYPNTYWQSCVSGSCCPMWSCSEKNFSLFSSIYFGWGWLASSFFFCLFLIQNTKEWNFEYHVYMKSNGINLLQKLTSSNFFMNSVNWHKIFLTQKRSKSHIWSLSSQSLKNAVERLISHQKFFRRYNCLWRFY